MWDYARVDGCSCGVSPGRHAVCVGCGGFLYKNAGPALLFVYPNAFALVAAHASLSVGWAHMQLVVKAAAWRLAALVAVHAICGGPPRGCGAVGFLKTTCSNHSRRRVCVTALSLSISCLASLASTNSHTMLCFWAAID